MAKQAGLGDNLYVGGYDLSGDIGSVQTIEASQVTNVVTGIDKSANERIGMLRDGKIAFNNFFNDAASAAHPVLKALQAQADVHAMYARGTTLGNYAAGLIAKQLNYNLARGADASLLGSVELQASAGYALEWGRLLTAGIRTDTAATEGDGYNFGAAGTLGLIAYLQVFDVTLVDATITIQESSDDAAGDPYAAVVGGAFAYASGDHVGERIATSAVQAVEKWLRVKTTTSGGITSLPFAVLAIINGV